MSVLTAAGIDYMVTGSIASSIQGEPRSTHDIDLVVAMPAAAAPKLVEAFPHPDYYVSEEAILEAVRQRSMFNLLWMADGDKVDFWMLTDEPFDQSRFARKRVEQILRVYEVQRATLDLDYLNHWASQLQVVDLWQRVQSEAEP